MTTEVLMAHTPEQAVESLNSNGKGRGTRTNGLGMELTHDYLEQAAVSKDGTAVIVRMTPSQALRFVDMIFGEED
jgi:hypothetical protein